MSISEFAPSTLGFLRIEIPPRRPRKGTDGFMSLRKPLVDDQGPHCDKPYHGITFVTSEGSTSFSYVPTPLPPN